MSARQLLNETQLEESYRQIIQLARILPTWRLTNKETQRPDWTDRSGEYQKSIGFLSEIVGELMADYSARVKNPNLMKHLFKVEI